MKKYLPAVFGALLLTVLANGTSAGPSGATFGQGDKPGAHTRALKLKVHYTGSGNVDEKHKVFVFVFNSTDFMQGNGQPVATNTVAGKDESITFSDLADSPVYVAVVYDPSGNYDGQSQPPSGASTAIYSKNPGVPEPITIEGGKTAEVVVAFDDSHKMQ